MVKSNADIDQERTSKQEAEKAQNDPFITGLAGKIKNNWEVARFARNVIEERIIDSLRRRNGEYNPEKLAKIREQGGSEIYMMLTSIKCRAAEAWINDVMFPAGDKPWKVEPSPIPELDPDTESSVAEYVQREAQEWMQQFQQILPPEAMQERLKQLTDQMQEHMQEEADKIAERMDLKIEDQTKEGNWKPAMKEVVKDVVTYPAGIIKGPIVRRRKTLKWEQDETTGKWAPVSGIDFRLEWSRVAPFDLYPSPSSKDVNDGYIFERHRLRRADLVAMKGVPGYDDAAIDLVLEQYGTGGLREWLWRDQERAWLEKRPNEWLNYDDTMDALEFWGSVSGKLLLDWGMSPDKIDDPFKEYEINAWLIGSYVIRAVINEDPLGKRPYDKCSFEEIPGAFWGFGVPEIMKDLQDICNAAARSLVNNMAIASGPQVEVHTDRVPIGEDITNLHPWKIWQTLSDPHGTNNPAVRFHNPQTYAKELMAVYDHFSNLADEYTGIPKYAYGENGSSGGAAGTASGLSMLMSSAARGIKQVIANLDKPIEGTIKRTFIFNMLNDEDETIKGDLGVVAKGATSLVAKEQQMLRRNEFLEQTNNPTDMAIMGLEGRATLLRESVKSFDIPIDDVVPDRETIVAKAKQAAMQAMMQSDNPALTGGGAAMDPAGAPAGGQDAALFG
ncbi:MAG TPA: hypothetical protein ENJ35_04250 [Gammaproteobacteria bacterium]|nr:hypothetical protein [Gammaproteobacteria bacterium]